MFGALVPKLVGQSQFFINDLTWEPVHILYADIRLKMHTLHTKIQHILQNTQNASSSNSPTILLVTVLQLLSRTETVDIPVPTEAEFKVHFFRLIAHNNMKVRELAAECLARFHQFYEIPDFLVRIVPLICKAELDANFRHGILCTSVQMLRKYESDSRCMPFADEWVTLKRRVLNELEQHWNNDSWRREEAGRYYLLVQFHRILGTIGGEEQTDVMTKFTTLDESNETKFLSDCNSYGFSAWQSIMSTQKGQPHSITSNCPLMELRRRSDE